MLGQDDKLFLIPVRQLLPTPPRMSSFSIFGVMDAFGHHTRP